MSVGKRIVQLRMQAGKSQREVSEETGIAVSYLSRLENNHINPSVRTLDKLARNLGVPVGTFFDGEPVLEAGDRCPVSTSGRCILDQLYVGRGRKPKGNRESYTPEQLELLRICNFLLHCGDRDIYSAISTMTRSLLALAESRHGGRLDEVIRQLNSSGE